MTESTNEGLLSEIRERDRNAVARTGDPDNDPLLRAEMDRRAMLMLYDAPRPETPAPDRCFNCDHDVNEHHPRDPAVGCSIYTAGLYGKPTKCPCTLDRRHARTGQPVLPPEALQLSMKLEDAGMTREQARTWVEDILHDAWQAGARSGLNELVEECPYLRSEIEW